MCTIKATTTIRCQHYRQQLEAMEAHARIDRRRIGVAGLLGWAMVLGGGALLVYLAYALLFTDLVADRAQTELRDRWQRQMAPGGDASAGALGATATGTGAFAGTAAPDGTVALLASARRGRSRPIVHDDHRSRRGDHQVERQVGE